jgi:protein-S-isoprenylcysteine O-methyltransferase Ste14
VTAALFTDVLFTLAAHTENGIFARFSGYLFVSTNAGHAYVSVPFLFGVILTLSGTYLRLACFHALGQGFTYDLAIRDSHKLITSGPYSLVRHPSYSALVSALLGVTFVQLSPGSVWWDTNVLESWFGNLVRMVVWSVWITIVSAMMTIVLRAPTEDAMLKEAFGKEWEAYAKRVRYWFIPGII